MRGVSIAFSLVDSGVRSCINDDIWRYALPVLLPIYTLVWFVFFSGHVVPLVAQP